jgi:hypothetical protein
VYDCGYGTRQKLSLSLGKYAAVFQAEVYAIKVCAVGNVDRGYKKRNIYMPLDSQAAIKSLDNYQITSKLVWDCHQPLVKLAKHNRVQLIYVRVAVLRLLKVVKLLISWQNWDLNVCL